jgi:hypothetical protein
MCAAAAAAVVLMDQGGSFSLGHLSYAPFLRKSSSAAEDDFGVLVQRFQIMEKYDHSLFHEKSCCELKFFIWKLLKSDEHITLQQLNKYCCGSWYIVDNIILFPSNALNHHKTTPTNILSIIVMI